MLKLLLCLLFIICSNLAFDQCQGYPCDTLWYNENGKLKDTFVFKEVRFMLGKADLQTDSTWYGTDTLFISQMYKNLDSLAYALILDTGFFEIQYHADCRYNNNSSSNLTGRRALAICLYLVQKGVKLEKLVPKGYAANLPRILTEGETKTLLTCNYVNKFKEADLAKYEFLQGLNRRVVIKRLSN